MKDRIAKYPGRVKLTPVSGQTNVYDMTRLDDPTQVGDPLNKNTLLKDATAALFGLGANAVPDEVLALIANERIPVVDATSSTDDMDVYAAQGAHLKWYRTGKDTQHTPYASGVTGLQNGLILSFASSTGACMQVSFTAGSHLMFVRRLYGTGSAPDAWAKLYTEHTKPTASDLGVYSLSDLGETIPEGADINTYTTPGRYRVTNGAAAKKLVTTSLPFDVLSLSYSGFTLVVERGYSGASHIIQTLIASDHRVCMREKFDGSWDSWALNYTTWHKPTAADVEAVSTSGGLMTGDLTISKSDARVRLLHTNGTGGVMRQYSNATVLTTYGDINDTANYRRLKMQDAKNEADFKKALVFQDSVSGTSTTYPIIHTGNITQNGVAKIETGSYVGTGTNGVNHPTEITFSFVPKMIWLWQVRSANSNGYGFSSLSSAYMISCFGLTDQYSRAGYLSGGHNTFHNKLVGKTFSFYYGSEAEDEDTGEIWYPDAGEQMNFAGTTYRYMAIG